jgi:hypothetical protein
MRTARRPAHGAIIRREQPHADPGRLAAQHFRHLINGGDTAKAIEFHVVALRDSGASPTGASTRQMAYSRPAMTPHM